MDRSDTRDKRKDSQRKKSYKYKSYRQRAADNRAFNKMLKDLSKDTQSLRDKLDKDS